MNFKHGCATGGKVSPEYKSWESMKSRCSNQNTEKYARYGGRGITVCPEWQASFAQFYADMGRRPAGMTLERKDNDLDYSPGNCVWASRTQQARNRHTNAPSGVVGVSFDKKQRKWRAHISSKNLGRFSTFAAAAEARREARAKMWGASA